MSRTTDKNSANSVVSPPPSLAANGARHRSGGNYTKSFGRSSFEQQQQQQQQQQKSKAQQPQPQPLQPASQEPLRRTHSKVAIRQNRQIRSPVYVADKSSADLSELSDTLPEEGDSGNEVDVSPLTTPAQSYLPEHRRRAGGRAGGGDLRQPSAAFPSSTSTSVTTAGTPPAPRVAFSGKHAELNADKENTNVNVMAPPAMSASASAGGVPAAVVAHASRPTLKSAAHTSTTPAVLYRRTPSGTRGTRPNAVSTSAATSAAAAPPKRTASVKVRPAAAGSRKVPITHAAATATAKERTPKSPTAESFSLSSKNDSASVADVEGGGVSAEEHYRASPPPPAPTADDAPPPATAAGCGGVKPLQRVPLAAPMNWRLREQLDQAESVLCYVAEVLQALGERRRCGPPPDSTHDFRASVVPCRRSAGRNDLDEDCGRGSGGSATSPDKQSSTTNDQGSSVALLPGLHRAASALLSAFTKLEYAQLSEDVDLALLESEAVEQSARLLRLVDGVSRQLALHESAEVRRIAAAHRSIFVELHHLVDFLSRMAQQVVLLRGIAAHHDLTEAREVLESFKTSVAMQDEQERQRRRQDQRGDNGNANHCNETENNVPETFLFSPLRVMQDSPFFQWLEQRWFPAMREWRQLVLEARQVASRGDIDLAIRRSRQDALQIAGVHEILRPGETVASLHQTQIVVPVTEIGKTFAQKRAVLDDLRRVLSAEDGECIDAAALAKAVKAAQNYARVRSGAAPYGSSSSNSSSPVADVEGLEEEAALIQQAEALLQRLREVEKLQESISALLQTPAPELVALLEHITRANDILVQWGLPHDEGTARAVLAAGQIALERSKMVTGRSSQQAWTQRSGRGSNGSAHAEHFHTPEVPPLNLTSLPGTPLPPPSPSPAPSSLAATHVTSTPAAAFIGDCFPPNFNVRTLYVSHTTRPPWSADLDILYRELCDVFTMLLAQRQAQRQLEQALGHTQDDVTTTTAQKLSRHGNTNPNSHSSGTGGAYPVAGFVTPSPQNTPHRPPFGINASPPPPTPSNTQREPSEEASPTLASTARSSASDGGVSFMTAPAASAEELRRRLQQAEEAGITGPLLDEARARLRRLQTLKLKIHFDAQTRVLLIADAATADFADVYEQLHAHCQAQLQQSACVSPGGAASGTADRKLRIRYEDAEGDFISLLTQQDWEVLMAEVTAMQEDGSSSNHHNGNGGASRMEVFCDYPVQLNMTPAPEERAAEEQQQKEEEEEDSASAVGGPSGREEKEGAGASTQTPEKQPNVFARLASAAAATGTAAAAVNAHAGRGNGGGMNTASGALGGTNKTPRGGRPRLGGAGNSGAAQRSRSGGLTGGGRVVPSPGKSPIATATAARKAAGDASPGKGGRHAGSPGNTPQTAELTADNLRRNIFRSPISTEGRRSGDTAGRSSGGNHSAKGPLRKSGHNNNDQHQRSSSPPAHATPDKVTSTNQSSPPPSSAQLEGGSSVEERWEQRRVVDGTAVPGSELPPSTVHIDVNAARRWDAAGDDDDAFQLLEIQTRASVSTVRMDPFPSRSSVEMAGMTTNSGSGGIATSPVVSRAAATAAGAAQKNKFTTTHCSGKTAGEAKPNATTTATKTTITSVSLKREEGRNVVSGGATVPAAEASRADNATSSSSSSSPRPATTCTEAKSAAGKAEVAQDEAVSRSRPAQSPPRRAPRRWASDDFSLDDVATVCSERSRVATQPVVPRGPQTLPPRGPQTLAGAATPAAAPPANRTPQRGRRGARGTPTRGRPDAAAGNEVGESDGAAAEDVFAEMQRMREENSRAMTQPRKAVWH